MKQLYNNIFIDEINKNIYCHILHDAGFFSVCTDCIFNITECSKYLNSNNIEYNNIYIDTNKTFKLYKTNTSNNFYDYFKVSNNFNTNNIINKSIDNNIALLPYSNINFDIINNYVNSFFQPSDNICKIINYIECKYNLDYENTYCIFYRGLDKTKETINPSYEEFYNKIYNETKDITNIKFLIQSDEAEAVEFFRNKFANNIVFSDEIRYLPKQQTLIEHNFSKEDNKKYSYFFIAIVYIMAKCKAIYCTTSNVSLWIALFRGNTNNFHQYLKQIDMLHGIMKNPLYNPNINEVWY